MTSHVKYDIELRMRQLIRAVLKGRPHWTRLEELTGTKAVKWRQFVSGLKNPTLEMVEALCTTYPQHAFWLVTGISDEDAGHLAPAGLSYPGRLPTGELPINEQEATASYFKACQQSAAMAWDELVAYLEEKQGRELTNVEIASVSLGLGEWFRSDMLPNVLGKETHTKLMQKLLWQQRSHLEESVLRLRLYHHDTDEIIDRQRAEELAMEEEVEKKIARQRASKASTKGQKQDTQKNGD
ncbi:hypothetical protein [Achromobacter denitrificans]|uniref:hypothetical protein n=1 Tax=Achromobacter denitrificans TaxID=32002 RepID=UPI000B48FF30|nr:hypothetical protein [Achromobacter denitrificans]